MAYKLKDLIKLVRAMSSSEKRHFSLLSSAFATGEEDPLYFQLFRTVSNPEIDFSEAFKNISSSVYTPAKRRLFTNICKSLRMYHQEQSIDMRLQNYLSDIEVLLGLNLPDQGLYIFKKAHKLSVVYEKFRLLLQLLEWERKLNIVLDYPTRTIEAIAKEEQEILQKLLQIVQLENIYSKVKDIKRLYGSNKSKSEKKLKAIIIEAKEMIPYTECASTKAKFYHNFIHALYYTMTFAPFKAYQFSKALLTSEIQTILPNDYVDGVLEHVTSCIHICRFQDALDGLDLAFKYIHEQNLNHIPAFDTKISFHKTGYHLLIYNYMGDKNKLAGAIKTAEEELKNHENSMSIEVRQVIYTNLRNSYIGIGNIQAAEKICEQLSHKSSRIIRRDVYDGLHLFRLFCLLQNKIYEVLPYTAQSAHRYYLQLQSINNSTVELKISSLLLKPYNFEDSKIKEGVLVNIKQILLDYISTLKNTNHFQEHYSFYVIWTESILQGCNYYEIAAQWYKRWTKDWNAPLI